MYLLQVQRPSGDLVQGFVSTTWPEEVRSPVQSTAPTWARLFLRSISLWSQLRPLSAAVRVELSPGRLPVTLHSFVVPAADAARLRAVLAAFLRTDGIGTATTITAYAQGELAGRFLHQGGTRIGLEREALRTGHGHTIIQDVRLCDYLLDILQASQTLGVPLAYEMQTAEGTACKDTLREVLYGIAHLRDGGAVPADLVSDQVRLGERLKRASFHLEECLWAPSPAAAEVAEQVLADVLARTVYGGFSAEPRIRYLSEQDAEPFACHVHSQIIDGELVRIPSHETAKLVTHADVERALLCRDLGLAGCLDGSVPPSVVDVNLSGLVANRPQAANSGVGVRTQNGPYFFVSYARNDAAAVYPVVDQVALENGPALWIDRQIMGGDDWIAELEERLLECSGLLAFISPRFAASRYCRREVQFADALGKPIVPVLVETTDLAGGLRFILQSRQSIPLADPRQAQRAIQEAMAAQLPGLR